MFFVLFASAHGQKRDKEAFTLMRKITKYDAEGLKYVSITKKDSIALKTCYYTRKGDSIDSFSWKINEKTINMFWISLGSTSSKLPDKPSIKTRGEFPALEKVPVPLIFTEAPAPGLPEFCNTLKPGASPANACAVLVTGLLANSLADTSCDV